MAWSSSDQNPTTSPSAAYGQTNYAAQLPASSYYNPMGSGTTMAPTSSGMPTAIGGINYADRLTAAAAVPQTPWETRETSRELATAADRTAAARRYTKEVSTTRGTSVQRQGDQAYDLLHPQAVQRFALAARQAHAEGIPVGINSAYRPPAMGIGGFRDKYKSTHAYGIGFDVSGIGRPGSTASKRWNEIATEHGLVNPYGPSNRKEYNHYQLIPEKSAYQIPGLRDTITGRGPIDVEQMWAASGVDPEGVPYSGGSSRVAGGMPSPRPRPQQGGTAMGYAPAPEAMESPFDAVLGSGDRRPQPAPQRARPQRETATDAQAPQGGAYTVQRGDSLSKIAQRELGDPNRWREIAQANGIRDPNMIQPGQRLVMPGGQAASVAAPRQEANMPLPRNNPRRDPNGFPIDVNRPQINNPDGSISTERTITFDAAEMGMPAEIVTVPTIVNGKQVSEDEARRLFATGQNPPVQQGFKTFDEADAAAQARTGSIAAARATNGRREVTMPTPPMRPERGANVPAPRMRPQQANPAPRATPEFWNSLGLGSRGNAETQMSINQSVEGQPVPANRPPMATREFWNEAGLGSRGTPETQMSIDQSIRNGMPAGPGMDTSGLIREPTPQERAMQGQPMPPPTGAQPMDPQLAAQIARTPAIITEIMPPTYVAPNGVQIWALR
jgi:LysM repeat protein